MSMSTGSSGSILYSAIGLADPGTRRDELPK
jgi:hypothetical protein